MRPRHFVRDSLFGARRLDWRWRLANGFLDKGDEAPTGLEVRWDGTLTTTLDLASALASLTLYGTDVAALRERGKERTR